MCPVCLQDKSGVSGLSGGRAWGRKEDTLVAITRTSRSRVVLGMSEDRHGSWINQCSSLMDCVTAVWGSVY